MATEKGIVIEIDGDTAWVKAERSSACESCSSKGACFSGGDGNEMKVKVVNTAGAIPGDMVVLNYGSSSLLKVTFFLYLFPILCMLGGVIAGMRLAPVWGMNESGLAAIIGFSCLLGSLVFIRVKGNRMSQKDEYQPKIIRILRRH